MAAKPQIPLGSIGGFGPVTTSLPPLGVTPIGSSSLSSFVGGLPPQVKVLGIHRLPDSGITGLSDSSVTQLSGPTLTGISASSLSSGLSSSNVNGFSGPTVSTLGGFSGGVQTVQPLGVKVLSVQRISDSSLGLTDGSLTGTELAGASFGGAGLSGATLSGATLGSATLAGAGLSGTTLGGATLAGAGLSGTTLQGASVGGGEAGAVLGAAGLQQLAGLGGTVTKIERITSSGASGGDVSGDLPISTIQQILKNTGAQQISGEGVQQIGSPRITQVTRIGGQSGSVTSTVSPLTPTTVTIKESTFSKTEEGVSTTQGKSQLKISYLIKLHCCVLFIYIHDLIMTCRNF